MYGSPYRYLCIGDPKGLNTICKAEMKLQDAGVNKVRKQKTIHDFF